MESKIEKSRAGMVSPEAGKCLLSRHFGPLSPLSLKEDKPTGLILRIIAEPRKSRMEAWELIFCCTCWPNQLLAIFGLRPVGAQNLTYLFCARYEMLVRARSETISRIWTPLL